MSQKLDEIRDELISLVEDGALEPERVVDAARNPNSSMHDQFEWDDSAAAEAHRLSQARALIKRVKIEVIRPDQEVVHVPVFIRAPEGRGYQMTQSVVMRRPDRLEVVLMALTNCETILKNLAAPEVDHIVNAIADLRSQIRIRLPHVA